jgi:hypothetical protein
VTLIFRVATPDGPWEESAPILNVYELKNLLEWLQAIAHGNPDVSEVELLEPALKFSIVKDSGKLVTIRIDFHLEDRPPIFALDAPTERQFVNIRLARDQVAIAAAELRRDLSSALLPSRGDEESEDWGIFGQGDADLNLLADADQGAISQLADTHDDFAEIDDAELREMGQREED